MRLASIAVPGPLGPVPRLVAAASGSGAPQLVDLTAAGELWWARAGCGDPVAWAAATFAPELSTFLRGGVRAMEMAGEALELAAAEGAGARSPGGAPLFWRPEEVERLPLLRPPMLRDFYAFEAHVAAGAARRGEPVPEPWYRRAVYYKGSPATILAPGAEVPWPAYTDALDYELEFACLLLAGGRDLDIRQAEAAIAGYAIFCDFSARDIQREEMQVRLGPAKSKDFASGLGPWLVTADEVGDPADLSAHLFLNGEAAGSGRLGEARWSFPEMIRYASGAEPVEAGEVIASGTVGGGSGQEHGRFLEPGDRVDCRLDGFGTLTHTIGPRHGGGGGAVPPAERS